MNFDTLCLSGGGINGFLYIGALDYLQTNNIIDFTKINNYIGTSIGAMTCFMLALDYSIKEIYDFFLDFNFKKLETETSIEQLFEKFAINDGNRISYMLSYFIQKKHKVSDMNFIDLYNINNKTLSIIGTNLTLSREELFNYKLTPNMSILTAIRISISIPIYFSPVFYNNCYYVDGGIVNNFPIKYCNSETTIAMCINFDIINEITSVIDIFKSCINIVCLNILTKDIKKYSNNIIFLKGSYDNTIRFDLTKEEKLTIINSGADITKKYIDDININICKNILYDIIDKL